jgi:hypothetical protein
MRARRVLISVVLIYVTLDFVSPHIAGAFVFNAAESVESVIARQDCLVGGIDLLPMPCPWLVLPEPQNDVSTDVPRTGIARRRHSVVSCLPRAHCAATAPSEDPS